MLIENIRNKQEEGLTYDKLKLLTGWKDLTEKKAEGIILSIRTLVDIIIHHQEQEDKIIELGNDIKQAA